MPAFSKMAAPGRFEKKKPRDGPGAFSNKKPRADMRSTRGVLTIERLHVRMDASKKEAPENKQPVGSCSASHYHTPVNQIFIPMPQTIFIVNLFIADVPKAVFF